MHPSVPSLIIVSGMSGSGKSVALNTFEDLGFYCVDNLPAELLPEFVRSVARDDGAPEKLAVGIDVRNRHTDLSNIPEWLSAVGALGLDPRLVFFDTAEEVLLKRYSDTRRRHPLSHLGLALADAISLERQVLKPLRQIADAVIDTSHLNVHQLRRQVITDFGLGHGRFAVAAVRIVCLQAWRAARCRLRVRCARAAEPALEARVAATLRP